MDSAQDITFPADLNSDEFRAACEQFGFPFNPESMHEHGIYAIREGVSGKPINGNIGIMVDVVGRTHDEALLAYRIQVAARIVECRAQLERHRAKMTADLRDVSDGLATIERLAPAVSR